MPFFENRWRLTSCILSLKTNQLSAGNTQLPDNSNDISINPLLRDLFRIKLMERNAPYTRRYALVG